MFWLWLAVVSTIALPVVLGAIRYVTKEEI